MKINIFFKSISAIFIGLLCSCTVTFDQLFSNNVSLSTISNNSTHEIEATSYSYNQDELDTLEIHFLELGNKYVGDAVYIKAGNTDILIDAGSRTTSSKTLTTYINQHCSDNTLEYVIATHAHQDHIAGFIGSKSNPGIFETYQCSTIIDFPLTNQSLLSDKGNATTYGNYVSLRDLEVENGAKHYTALECYNNENGASRTYQVANGITLSILYNEFYEVSSSNENNYSVCVLLTQGNNNFLFTGDLEIEGEEKLVANNYLPHCKVFKGGHHGSGTANGDVLLNAITPENIMICTCAGTSEYTSTKDNQFPYQEAINRMAIHTKNIYVTTQVNNYVDTGWGSYGTVKSMNGNIVVTSTKDNFTINCSNNNLILKDTEWFKANRTWPENGVQ